jgi:signal transduction histidine kinase
LCYSQSDGDKSSEGAQLREVCRSRPAFGKQLLFASALFIGLFVADLFVVGHLAFLDLSRTVIDDAFKQSLSALRPPAVPLDPLAEDDSPAAPIEPCTIGDPVSTDDAIPCPPSVARSGGRVFRSLTVRLERALMDMRGRVLWRDFRMGSLLDPADRPPMLPGAGRQRVREQWQVGGQPKSVIAIRETAQPGGNEILEVGIAEDLIEQEVAQLRTSLQTKLWIGAGVAVLILLIAFLYVLRLLRRTRALEAQAQMDDRLAFVGGLAAGLAHEIRNPLNVLSMNLQMLEEDVSGRLGAEGGEARLYLATLQGEIRRLSHLVDNFLTYARPGQPRFESRDLNQVAAATCLLVRPQFEARHVVLREDLAPFLPAVDLDEALIRTAIMNILMNAAQILPKGGQVTVKTAVSPDGGVALSVTDDGPGIKPEDRGKVFDVFYSNRPGGTGLGLAIAARILEAHGGGISVESGPGGKGARFVLRLPRRHAADSAPASGAVAVSRP